MKTEADLILIVDDDKRIRDYLQIVLRKMGHATVTASSCAEARKLLRPGHIGSVQCVLTDFHMPFEDGLSLLRWIQETDPDLATILVTCDNERELVAQSIRDGAIDFLEKPIDSVKLRAAVARGTQRTKHQRARARSHGEVQTLARTQKRFLDSATTRGVAKLEICSQPKAGAGGDFFTHVEIAPGKQIFILTDVSGHDLQAAYVSAYFHGMLRGMLARDTPFEEVIEYFNNFLVNEWNRNPAEGGGVPVMTSISISAILLDSASGSACIWNYGSPAPIHISTNGAIEVNTAPAGAPLGWFADVATHGRVHSVQPEDMFMMWTDGLADLAERHGVDPLSLAFAYRTAHARGEALPILDDATDDILLAAFLLEGAHSQGILEPIFHETYQGSQFSQIDEIQARWERSLLLAVPGIEESNLYNINLAIREAVLNGLIHGCQKSEGKTASLSISFRPQDGELRISVRDTGEGHQFDLAAHAARAENELVENHRGLLLIRRLALTFLVEADGRALAMTFNSRAQTANFI